MKTAKMLYMLVYFSKSYLVPVHSLGPPSVEVLVLAYLVWAIGSSVGVSGSPGLGYRV